MYAWESIQKAVDYVEDDIAACHCPEDLAKIAALSTFYFQRLFARLVRRPVGEYVKMRRLARACETLPDKSKRILDVALDCGFSSHEHFTKTFKSAFGITPEAFRERPAHLSQVIKPDLSLGYTMIDEGVPLITDGIVIEIARRTLAAPETYIGISGKFPLSQASLGEATAIGGPGRVWDDFHELKGGLSCLLPGGMELGASLLSGDDGEPLLYFAGAAATPGAPAPEGCMRWELPAGEYVVCQIEAESFEELVGSAINKALKYLLETWLPGRKLQIHPFSAEKYTGISDGASSMEVLVRVIVGDEA